MNIPEISRETIRILAIQYGFTLRKQPGGEFDLNPYMYDFARKLINMAGDQVACAAPTSPAKTWRTNGDTCLNCGKRITQHENQTFCPTPPEVEPVAWRYKTVRGFWRYVGNRPKPHGYMPSEVCFPEPLFTLPPSSKAEITRLKDEISDLLIHVHPDREARYDATGEPLNLRAAAKDAVTFYNEVDSVNEERIIANLRKFLGESS